MYTVADIVRAMDVIAPLCTQLDWDNSGLLVGDPAKGVERVLVALDATLSVIEKAEEVGAGLIVTHHPIIFRPVKRFLAGEPAYEAAVRGIAVYSAHTCYDMAEAGVNAALADALGLRGRCPLWEERPGDAAGRRLGVAGELPCGMCREELAAWVEEALGLGAGYVRWPGEAGAEVITRVAVCGGAGADYLLEAIALGCQAYITGDVRHHEFLEAERLGLLLMDAGHGATEAIAMPQLQKQLSAALPGVQVLLA